MEKNSFAKSGLLIRGAGIANAVFFLWVLSLGLDGVASKFAENALQFEGCVAFSLLLWFALMQKLQEPKMSLILSISTGCFAALSSYVLGEPPLTPFVLGFSVCFGIAKSLYWRAKSLSPSWAEARLMTLSSRIRPHFLFNALNAITTLIHRDPDKAEDAIMNLCDVFRSFLKDRDYISFSEELGTCRKYLEIEKLRLGNRLKVKWDIPSIPPDVEIPALLLQPLLENAVRYGVEATPAGGEISIRVLFMNDKIRLSVKNPFAENAENKKGNGIALSNIKERLALRYDLDAGIESIRKDGVHETKITMPLRRRSENIAG